MSVYLDGVAVQFYRGIGSETQFASPFTRMNFFIGANNAGKSIILNFIANRLPGFKASRGTTPLEGPEIYQGEINGEFRPAIGFSKDKFRSAFENLATLRNTQAAQKRSVTPSFLEAVEEILDAISYKGHIWVTNSKNGGREILETESFDESVKHLNPKATKLWTTLNGSGHIPVDVTDRVLAQAVKALKTASTEIYIIPAKREIGPTGGKLEGLNGSGVIDHLADLQSPDWDRPEDAGKFEKINYFLQDVIGKKDARLRIPNSKAHILVHIDGKVLPLSSLGTGTHEVIMIAVFCTIYDNSIMCIEEPEIHLHPILQRKLVSYLLNSTQNQYFIATHSSSFIDTPDSNVFHVSNDGVQTRVSPALTRESQRRILDDLGYHASNLLQSNAVIWVEGPSDRLYVVHWLKAFDCELKEGTHFTVMFYGGSLISHLSASDEALDDFIKLRDLNRHMAIVLDSDRDRSDAPLKPHAQRIRDEMERGKGMVWITQGREIENYVDPNCLQSALQTLHPRIYEKAGNTGPYDHAFYFLRSPKQDGGRKETYKEGDKVGAARILCGEEADLDRLDLRDRVQELATLIREANGMEILA